jgi:hypothetical protein
MPLLIRQSRGRVARCGRSRWSKVAGRVGDHGVGEDPRASAAVELLAVGEQGVDGLLVEGDGAMNGQPARFLFPTFGFPFGRVDGWSSEFEAAWPGDGAVVQGEVGSEVLPAQRDQL